MTQGSFSKFDHQQFFVLKKKMFITTSWTGIKKLSVHLNDEDATGSDYVPCQFSNIKSESHMRETFYRIKFIWGMLV